MKIKKYLAETNHEAMQKLKSELGSDAVILSTRTVRRKGIFKYFKKPLVEITAAFEEKDIRTSDNIRDELNEIKDIVKKLSINKNENKINSSNLTKFYDKMVLNGVKPNIAHSILKNIEEEIDLETKEEETIRKIVEYNLMEILGNPKSISVEDEQKIIFFVGATGVGKTTTLAKIAANLVLEETMEIGLITSDTYRIAAVEQLKIYSNILQLPLEIVYNKSDTIKAIDKFKNKKIILVDTAGRNHNDLDQIKKLDDVLDIDCKKEIFLVISANTDYNLMKSLVEKYGFLEEFKLIVTKIDEVESYGSLLNIKYITNKEIPYYTTGQNVPDDIKKMNVEEIVEKLVGEKKHE